MMYGQRLKLLYDSFTIIMFDASFLCISSASAPVKLKDNIVSGEPSALYVTVAVATIDISFSLDCIYS
jgi:hypothetical protein